MLQAIAARGSPRLSVRLPGSAPKVSWARSREGKAVVNRLLVTMLGHCN
jgi:hypothetical protein